MQYGYILMQWIKGLTALLFVQGRGEMAVMPAVTALLLHHSAMDKGTSYSVVSAE